MESQRKSYKKARELRPKSIKFLNDFSTRTVEKQNDQWQELVDARRARKIAYSVAGKLVVHDKSHSKPKFVKVASSRPPDLGQKSTGNDEDSEICFKL